MAASASAMFLFTSLQQKNGIVKGKDPNGICFKDLFDPISTGGVRGYTIYHRGMFLSRTLERQMILN